MIRESSTTLMPPPPVPPSHGGPPPAIVGKLSRQVSSISSVRARPRPVAKSSRVCQPRPAAPQPKKKPKPVVKQPRTQTIEEIQKIYRSKPEYVKRSINILQALGHMSHFDKSILRVADTESKRVVPSGLNSLEAKAGANYTTEERLMKLEEIMTTIANQVLDTIAEKLPERSAYKLEDAVNRSDQVASIRMSLLEHFIVMSPVDRRFFFLKNGPAEEMFSSAQRIFKLAVAAGHERKDVVICIPGNHNGTKFLRIPAARDNVPFKINVFGIKTTEKAIDFGVGGATMVTMHLGQVCWNDPTKEHPMIEVVKQTDEKFRKYGAKKKISLFVSGASTLQEIDTLRENIDGLIRVPHIEQPLFTSAITSLRQPAAAPQTFAGPGEFDFGAYDRNFDNLSDKLYSILMNQAWRRDQARQRSAPPSDDGFARQPGVVVANPTNPARTLKRTMSKLDVTETVTQSGTGKKRRVD
ncbi:hypothetical protein VNI00_004319 [Paramarasmius palmivorus]|uniref:Uncharacterized protein n=1 Tax=Paramarasmius palmivorus TaxID=297713 RepID=A0AAW0DP00_9AGAR